MNKPHRRTSSKVLSTKDLNEELSQSFPFSTRAPSPESTFAKSRINHYEGNGENYRMGREEMKEIRFGSQAVGNVPNPKTFSPLPLRTPGSVSTYETELNKSDFDQPSSPEMKLKANGGQFRSNQSQYRKNEVRNDLLLQFEGARNSKLSNKTTFWNKKFQNIALSDFTLLIIFFLCLLAFFDALLGRGYIDPTNPPLTNYEEFNKLQNLRVEIPSTFLPTLPVVLEDILAEVYNPTGDSSQEKGSVEIIKNSPIDPTLEDEHVHHHHSTVGSILNSETEGEVGIHEPNSHEVILEIGLEEADSFHARYDDTD